MDNKCIHAREVLDAFSSRKEMYLSQVTVEHAETFLNGFDIGCLACGVRLDWQTAAQRRGWNLDSNDWIDHMRGRGLSDGQIIDELIAFRSDALLNLPAESVSSVFIRG